MEFLGKMVLPRIDRVDPNASVLWIVLRVFWAAKANQHENIEAARKAMCKAGLLAVSTVYEKDEDARILCRVECDSARALALERRFLSEGVVDLNKMILEVLACKVEH